VAEHGEYALHAARLELPGQIAQRASGYGEVVNDKRILTLDVADYLQHLGVFVMCDAALIAYRNRQTQLCTEAARLLCKARVRGHDDGFVQRYLHALERLAQQRQRVQVIHRAREEAHHLRRMQIHYHYAVGARHLDTVRAHAAAYRHARLVLLIALGIGEIRHDHSYRGRAGALERVQPEQHFDKLIVGIQSHRLHKIYVAVAHRLLKAHKAGAFRKSDYLAVAQRTAHI